MYEIKRLGKGGHIILSGDDTSVKLIWNNIIGKSFEKSEFMNWMVYLDTVVIEDILVKKYCRALELLKDGVVIDTEDRLDMFRRAKVKGIHKFEDILTIVPTVEGYKFEPTKLGNVASGYYYLHKLPCGNYTARVDYADGMSKWYTVAYIKADSVPSFVGYEGTELQRTLRTCDISMNVVSLPKGNKLKPELYKKVKNTLEKIGGKWSTSFQGFEFKHDARPLVARLIDGDKINLKQDFQYFATPRNLVDEMVELADIQPTDKMLEPSGGQGAIVEVVEELCDSVDICEFMSQNREVLKSKGYEVICDDFLELSTEKKYNKIIANPPFSKDQDCKHVLKMYEHLVVGGTLVAIMSKSWMRDNKNLVQARFAELVNRKGNTLTNIESGEFKDSGTNVATVLVKITK